MRTGISITLKPADRRRLKALARDRNTPHKHVWRAGADSEEKHEPASDIDTAVDSLKVLDPKWPIREADIDPSDRGTPKPWLRSREIAFTHCAPDTKAQQPKRGRAIGSKTDSTSVFEYRERLTSISAFSMPSARASKRSDGLVGFRWKPSWFLHHRLRGQRFENGVTGDVSRRTASKSAQGAYESNKHEDFFHLISLFLIPYL